MQDQIDRDVQVRRAGGVLTLTLNRPAVRNALNHDMVDIITREVSGAAGDAAIRAVVLTAAGSVFSAGVDLARLQRLSSATREENIADAMALCGMLRAVFTLPKPVIAAVQGSVHGGAVGLISACDIVIAADGCRFATAEARVGLAPILLAPYLAAAIGIRASRFHLLTGQPIDAQEALRLGLVHKLVAPEALDSALTDVLDAIRRGGPSALHVTKRMLAEGAALPLEEGAMLHAAGMIADARAGAEAKEGVAAFLGKRAPIWPLA
jgi:methylglutaconyl-CoA hydratase